jgi:hypothetical protein
MNYKLPKSYQNLHKTENFDAEKPFVWAASGSKGEKDTKTLTDVVVVNIPAELLTGASPAVEKCIYHSMTRKAQEQIQAYRKTNTSYDVMASDFAQDFLDWANSVKPELAIKAPKVLTPESMAIEDIAKAIVFHKPGTKIADARKRAVEFHKAGQTKIWVAALASATEKFNALQNAPEGEEW